MRAFDAFIAASRACHVATDAFLALNRAMGANPSEKQRNDWLQAARLCEDLHEEFLSASAAYRDALAD